MNQATSTELVLPLTDLAHLFRAPHVDPAAPGPLEGLGVSGVEYLLGQLHLDKRRQQARRLVLLLPAEKAAAVGAEQTTSALRRQTQWRIEHEQRELRNTYRYGWRVSVFAIVTLTICLALSSLFASDVTEWMLPLMRTTFEYGFEIIGWVVLWHPIDVMVFAPVAIRARLAALQALATLNIIIRTDPTLAVGPGASGAQPVESPSYPSPSV